MVPQAVRSPHSDCHVECVDPVQEGEAAEHHFPEVPDGGMYIGIGFIGMKHYIYVF